MTNRNSRIRFCQNNFAELTSGQIAYSSQLSSFPFTNSINKFRSRVWKPSGRFTIDSSNKYIYINDGSNKTITLTEDSYATPNLLAAHIETQLNLSSSNWTVSYNTLTGDYRFKMENTGSVTLLLSETIDASWDTIGFTTNSDLTGTSFLADQQRNHTSEDVTFDLGYNASITFAALIGPLDEVFSISSNATVTLMGSNLDQWDAPPFSLELTTNSKGILTFLDDQDDTGFRFWRIEIIDKMNPLGPEGISIGNIYLGDYITFETRNIASGFQIQDIDPSEITESESGVLHFDNKTKYGSITAATVNYLPREDKDSIRTMFEILGKTTPFYISLDPTNCVTDNLNELTRYVVFAKEPSFKHIFSDVFSISFEFREVV